MIEQFPPLNPLETAILRALQTETYYPNSIMDHVACGWLRKLGLAEKVVDEDQNRYGITPAGQELATEMDLKRLDE
ncbi:MAG: hypothetical protein KKG69_18190 [Alphaproteobacteria bacterium]|uniref:Uncharacterized protein n=1 Tax=viral metagenome TaxID=1070528 RepID=A0A6H1ZDI5_9ZZZZ|nr:hypothetical protein [Alphaproteobacteria bacterium]